LISKKQTKNGIIDKNTLKEFHPGFFDFLDKLYICIRDGNIGNEILDLIKKWIPLLTTNIKEREIRVYNKYQIIFSEWMEKEIEKLEKSNP